MAAIKRLAKYDPILATRLEKPKGSIKYLGHQIQNQIIVSLESEIKKSILFDVTFTPFFPLNSKFNTRCKQDYQVSTKYRYMHIVKNKLGIPINIEIVEDFIGFSETEGSGVQVK